MGRLVSRLESRDGEVRGVLSRFEMPSKFRIALWDGLMASTQSCHDALVQELDRVAALVLALR